ncbi:hypothetical protein SODALDRAFT_352193 [Sodiomyces alkalinus F11]|uniref:Uncharacterized protein n=1 Tax=Sodiomyces alkalinus (strain CBS 110278 / VKM F-3762 / F11) TaxID=1314773 RepID=A0A3N2PR46_SODAK|nr:hypothetical protein SODALDRAFT_352193 [Sodiomyces alkalinus F11]ROT36989.1 hypothetical protein SODALDRAFT_352193 [Sodiomyces alkalinus F11]
MARTRSLSSEGAAVYVSLNSWPGDDDVTPMAKISQPADVNLWSIAKLAATNPMPVRPVREGSSSPLPNPHGVRRYARDEETRGAGRHGNAKSLEISSSPSQGPRVYLKNSRQLPMPTTRNEFDSCGHDETPIVQGPPTTVILGAQDGRSLQEGCHRMDGYALHHRVLEDASEAASPGLMALANNAAAASKTSQGIVPTDAEFIYHTPPPSAGRKRPTVQGHNPPYHVSPRDAESVEGLGGLVTPRDIRSTDWPLPSRRSLERQEEAQFHPILRAAPLPFSLHSDTGKGQGSEQSPNRSFSSTMGEDDPWRYLIKRQRSVVRSGDTLPKRLKSSWLPLENITDGALSLQRNSRAIDVAMLEPLIEMLASYETYVTYGNMEPGLPTRPWELVDVDLRFMLDLGRGALVDSYSAQVPIVLRLRTGRYVGSDVYWVSEMKVAFEGDSRTALMGQAMQTMYLHRVHSTVYLYLTCDEN